MRARLLGPLCLLVALSQWSPAESADAPATAADCPKIASTLGDTFAECNGSPTHDHATSTATSVHEEAGHSYLYRVELQCKLVKEEVCAIPITCAAPPNTFLANVFRSVDGGDFERYGIECLTHAQVKAAQQPVLTPGMIERAFQRLEWPGSRVVQPPGGRTLVNLATILHTGNTTATTQTVRLLGQAITIRARPARYTWHFGDGTSATTTSPGHAYPEAGYHDVMHTYTRKARGVVLSVDTEYVGEYRLGTGPWVQIPEPRTIVGPPVAISVDTATPHLVAGE